MSDTQLQWKMIRVDEHDLESTLNELSCQDYEIFSVQFTGSHWCIVVRKSISNKGGKTMGFSAGI
jgi:hypothetical protein